MGGPGSGRRVDTRESWQKRDDSRQRAQEANKANRIEKVVDWDVQIARLRAMLRKMY